MTTHASTTTAKRREADRLRKQRQRAERKAAGAPEPHQVDLAVAEAFSFVLAMSLLPGAEKVPADATLSVRKMVQVAINILVRRWRFEKVQAAKALQARIGKRPDHANVQWYPHFPSAEPSFWKDLSARDLPNTPVTPSGLVQQTDEKVTHT